MGHQYREKCNFQVWYVLLKNRKIKTVHQKCFKTMVYTFIIVNDYYEKNMWFVSKKNTNTTLVFLLYNY